MLEQSSSTEFDSLVSSLPMRILLPSHLEEALERERGACETNPFENRTAVRFRCNGRAVMELKDSSSAYPSQDKRVIVIVRDLSRSGMGVISHQQWFPDQEVDILVENGVLTATVVRARRIASRCYEIGTKVTQFRGQ